MGAFGSLNLLKLVGWGLVFIFIIGAIIYFAFYYKSLKLFKRSLTAFEAVGIHYEPAIRDKVKIVKLGKGGFEILYLKKAKTWKLAYGGRVGRNTYYFFIGPDGYWYNGMLSANLMEIDKNGGLIPIHVTNPNIRAQYTSLEKQIDSLHADKKKWWDQYGSYVLSIGFLVIAGMMLWLNYREYVSAVNALNTVVDKLGTLIDKVNVLTSNAQTGVDTGLVPVGG